MRSPPDELSAFAGSSLQSAPLRIACSPWARISTASPDHRDWATHCSHSQVSGKVPVFLETPKINGTHDYHYPNCWGQQSGQGLVRSARTFSVIIRQHFKSFQSKQELHAEIKMGAGAGEGQPGGGWGTQSMAGHWAGLLSQAGTVRVVDGSVTQVPLWMDMPFITLIIMTGDCLS